jgi:hypothetical protein
LPVCDLPSSFSCPQPISMADKMMQIDILVLMTIFEIEGNQIQV